MNPLPYNHFCCSGVNNSNLSLMSKNKAIVIQGSSRSHGDTRQYVNFLLELGQLDFEDLWNHKIGQYDYEYMNKDDDYLPLITRLIEDYDTWIVATPIYWYTMSGVLKTFLDRLSDLIRIHKDTGRKLRGMNLAALGISHGENFPEHFFKPFESSADYLGMNYLGSCHAWGDPKNINESIQRELTSFHNLVLTP